MDYAERHPEASSIYCDMQHVGTRQDIVQHKSVTGFALQRVLEQAQRANPAVIRCLIRREAMLSALPISSATTWTIAIARFGELHRIPRVLYFRRNRANSLGMQMLRMTDDEMLAFTLEYGLGVVKYAHTLVQREELAQLLATVMDQLINAQIRKQWQFDFASADPAFRNKFISDFLATSVRQFGIDPRYAEEARARIKLAAGGECTSAQAPGHRFDVVKPELQAALARKLLRQRDSFEKKLEEKSSELKARRAQVQKLEAELIRSRKEAAHFKAELEAVLKSRSWRVTAPLRIIIERVRRQSRSK